VEGFDDGVNRKKGENTRCPFFKGHSMGSSGLRVSQGGQKFPQKVKGGKSTFVKNLVEQLLNGAVKKRDPKCGGVTRTQMKIGGLVADLTGFETVPAGWPKRNQVGFTGRAQRRPEKGPPKRYQEKNPGFRGEANGKENLEKAVSSITTRKKN